MTQFRWVIDEITLEAAETYRQQLIAQGLEGVGQFFKQKLEGIALHQLSTQDFLDLLIQTKNNEIAPSHTISTWNKTEERILGGVVLLTDEKRAYFPISLLKASEAGERSADYDDLKVSSFVLNEKVYNDLYGRRLRLLFQLINEYAKEVGQRAVINMATLVEYEHVGPNFGEQYIKKFFNKALLNVLQKAQFNAIDTIYYDTPFYSVHNCAASLSQQVHNVHIKEQPQELSEDNLPEDCFLVDVKSMHFGGAPLMAGNTASVRVLKEDEFIDNFEAGPESSFSPIREEGAGVSCAERTQDAPAFSTASSLASDARDYTFEAKCLFGLMMLGGGALLVVGIFVSNPVYMGVGAGVFAVGTIGFVASCYGLFGGCGIANESEPEVSPQQEMP